MKDLLTIYLFLDDACDEEDVCGDSGNCSYEETKGTFECNCLSSVGEYCESKISIL